MSMQKSMSSLDRARSFALGTLAAAAFSISFAFVESAPAYAKVAPQPAVLAASAVAVADKFAADSAGSAHNGNMLVFHLSLQK